MDDKGALHDDSLCRKRVECVWIRLLPYVRDRARGPVGGTHPNMLL
ncbi:hypothetical protein DESPIGER_2031 [Desulfovibrio piger]|uniref:Uncharacterized protein n=1 Tax=Desulfovibrio piger TaxID=901 RepID=A0A1K1LGL1_9BACT|nr:hypothetical protein DESPIGER_2031 [Desulfovibrio piger]